MLQADMSNISEGDREEAIESAKKVIERRVNLFGVTEPTIQTSKIGQDYTRSSLVLLWFLVYGAVL